MLHWEIIVLLVIVIQLVFLVFAVAAIIEGSKTLDHFKIWLGVFGIIIPFVGVVAFLIHKDRVRKYYEKHGDIIRNEEDPFEENIF